VKLSLLVTDPNGQPIKNAKVRLQIQTPPPTPWFTTDFPIVEGTQLLNLEAVAPEGKLELQQVFPIRGTYQLSVTATPPNAASPIQKTLPLTIPEAPEKYRNLVILVAILFGVGWLGGQIIGRRHPLQVGEIAPQPVRLLLSGTMGVAIIALLAVNISAERTESHQHDHEAHHPVNNERDTAKQVLMGTQLKLTGDDIPSVGHLANLAIQSTPLKSEKFTDKLWFQIRTIQLEDNETTFAYQTVTRFPGDLTWQQQFYDGAPHRVEVTVMPHPDTSSPFKPITLSRIIHVQGVAPPLTTRLISLAYLTGVVGIGLAFGLWQQQRQLEA
jgi:hypothetical protein